MNRPLVRLLALACAVIVWPLLPAVAWPHDIPPDLALWGPFGARSVHCQRMLGNAADRCFKLVLAAQRQCMDAEMAHGLCDVAQRDADVGAAQQAAQAVPTAECLGGQLTELRFNGFDETKADIVRGCAQAGPVMSMIYAPAPAAEGDDATRKCVLHVSSLSQAFARAVLRLKTHALDHIAVNVVQPSRKNAIMARVSVRIATARQRMADRLEQSCPAFLALYGQDAAAFLTALEGRTNCVVASTYVQGAITCKAICGDGVTEPGEQCDDGNTNDGDACHNDCTSSQ